MGIDYVETTLRKTVVKFTKPLFTLKLANYYCLTDSHFHIISCSIKHNVFYVNWFSVQEPGETIHFNKA